MNFNQHDDRELVPATRRQPATPVAAADETTAVLNQADALMRRHRVFVAGAEAAPNLITPLTPPDPLDDLPVLTDAVDKPPVASRFQYIETAKSDPGRHAAMAGIVSRWLDQELPIAMQQLNEELIDQLVLRLSAKAKSELVGRLIEALDKPEAG